MFGKLSEGKGLHEYKKGQVSLTPEEKEVLAKKGVDPELVMTQATERIRTDSKKTGINTEDIAQGVINSVDMKKYMGFVKVAEFASVKDREDMANQVSEDIKSLSIYGSLVEVVPVLNKLNSIYKYLTGKDL